MLGLLAFNVPSEVKIYIYMYICIKTGISVRKVIILTCKKGVHYKIHYPLLSSSLNGIYHIFIHQIFKERRQITYY